tara:strand:- start:1648 stop:2172 length:525 start_codon:yes stop_codon:yes gene_type:complete
MSDFTSLVQKLNSIGNNEQVDITPSEETVTKRKEIAETASLLNRFNAIQEVNPYKPVAEAKEEEVEETMQDRFAQFLKAERAAGSDVEAMRVAIEEGTAEYEYCDRAFTKMAETINTLEQMVREGGMLERKIGQAGGDPAALVDMREALSAAYEAYEQCHMDALGSTPEQQPED